MPDPQRVNLVAACAVSVACGWNLTAVGAVADPLATHYGASLGTIGLLGSGLWLTHALVQAPAGEAADRAGVRIVGLVSVGLLLLTNLVALLVGDVVVLGVLRVVTGLGCGTTMVTASLRSQPTGPVGQGAVGGAVSAGAALAVATGPLFEDAIGWRAPYVGGAVLAAV
ncbi:MAG: putative sugar transporter, partial [Frankiales bacterium]|nr:putative sugar transporter [Frankiales bacterium]